MNSNPLIRSAAILKFCGLVACLSLVACTSAPKLLVPRLDSVEPAPTLAYYQSLSRMNPVELGRERSALASLPPAPNTQLRQAMLLGHPRAPQDLTKAISLLDGILKANDPAAVSLHPLARLLADNYLERQRLEIQLERQGGQLKESQKKAVELQEKIDGLADIERTLPQRARPARPAQARGAK